MKIFPEYCVCALLSLMIFACATPGSPSGGPVDKTPPQLDSLESTPNFQTHFTRQNITLTFDEWIKLEDVFTQVVISPPLRYPPDIRVRGKDVIVEFDEKEELKENATYTINFGNAVQDLNAGNAITDLRFVFSTGPVIDSLTLQGEVNDALTNQPVEGALVMLYETLADSVIKTSRPFYFAKTNAGGKFTLENLKADTFRVFTLLDGNLNYRFDLEDEKIDVLPEDIILTDTFAMPLSFRIYTPVPELRLLDVDSSAMGKVALSFNRPPYEDFTYELLDEGVTFFTENVADSLIIWHKATQPQTWTLESNLDTFSVKTRDYQPGRVPAIASYTQKVKYGEPFFITYTRPIAEADTQRVSLRIDSIYYPVGKNISVEDTISRRLQVNYPWLSDSMYVITLDTGAVTGFFGGRTDSTWLSFRIMSPKELGNLDLRLAGLHDSLQYVVQLLDKNDRLIEEDILTGQPGWKHVYKKLLPERYTLRVIEDTNENGRWDPGIWRERIPAERVVEQQSPNLRANWDIEFTINLENKL